MITEKISEIFEKILSEKNIFTAKIGISAYLLKILLKNSTLKYRTIC